MGVVSGIVMWRQFGTNWAAFNDAAGGVFGPLMAYEVLTAFFLETGSPGVMPFGTDKVGKGLHAFATCAVALGTLLSAFWILSTNSWMQPPQARSSAPMAAGRGGVAGAAADDHRAAIVRWPFFLSLTLFAPCFVGLGIPVYSDIIPGTLIIREAAAPEKSQVF